MSRVMRWVTLPARWFNRVFDWTSNLYAGIVSRLVRRSALSLLLYGGLIVATWLQLWFGSHRVYSQTRPRDSYYRDPVARWCCTGANRRSH